MDRTSIVVHIRQTQHRTPPEWLTAALSKQDSPFLLDSADPSGGQRWTMAGMSPVRILQCDDLRGPNPFDELERSVVADRASPTPPPIPFAGGWVGYIGYETGRFLESLPGSAAAKLPLPWTRLGLYDTVALFDHKSKQWTLAAIDGLAESTASVRERMDRWETLLAAIEASGAPRLVTVSCAGLLPNMAHDTYVQRVERALEYIREGDIFQVNLAVQFRGRTPSSATDLYRRLRKTNPAPFAALLLWDESAVLSSSPELFLSVRNGKIVTRPIKGTAPRLGSEPDDALARKRLFESPKNNAELTMIVDLLRNDLGRVCRFGSISVDRPWAVESYAFVHHLVATIRGELEHDRNCINLLEAAFPGGSITGAPKIRAMQIIDELETDQRGPYCGSIGYIGLDGAMTLNIAIRTISFHNGQIAVPAGGAIVADSDPRDEYLEILAKARGMFQALGVESPIEEPQQAR